MTAICYGILTAIIAHITYFTAFGFRTEGIIPEIFIIPPIFLLGIIVRLSLDDEEE